MQNETCNSIIKWKLKFKYLLLVVKERDMSEDGELSPRNNHLDDIILPK